MDVRLDQTRTGEAPLGIVDLGMRAESRTDRDDAAVLDADVNRRMLARTIGKPRVADNQIHAFSLLRGAIRPVVKPICCSRRHSLSKAYHTDRKSTRLNSSHRCIS